MNKKDEIFEAITIFLRTVCIFINLLGIYCLKKKKRTNSNREILLHLSFVSIAYSVNMIVIRLLTLFKTSDDVLVHVIAWDGGVDITFYLILNFLTLDRLACTVFPWRYKSIKILKITKRYMYFGWAVGFVCGIPFHFCDMSVTSDFFYHYCYVICDTITITIAVASYTVVCYVLHAQSKKAQKKKRKCKSTKFPRSSKNVLRIAVAIVLTYVIFYAIPDVIIKVESDSDVFSVMMVMWSIGALSDPLLYIFMDSTSRKIAIKVFTCYG